LGFKPFDPTSRRYDRFDLFLLKESFALCGGKRLPLKGYEVERLGDDRYRFKLLFEGKKEERKRLGPLEVTLSYPRRSLKISIEAFYRGGRFIFLKTRGDYGVFDLSPKCVFEKKDGALVPKFQKKRLEVREGNCSVSIFVTFDRCF